KGPFWAWGEGGGHVVWGRGDLAHNLGAVLIRRLMDAEKNGEPLPPLDSPFPVALADVTAVLAGDVCDTRLEELPWGLSLVERGEEWEAAKANLDAELPRAYALIKLTMLPGKLEWEPSGDGHRFILRQPRSDEKILKPELAIPAKLRAGDVQGACEVAA